MNSKIFPVLLQRYFTDYLRSQRNVSAHTVDAYADTFRLLLRFLSAHHHVPIDQLAFAQFTPEAILAFLNHLENERSNTIRTRNLRLAAIRAFVRFAMSESGPDFIASARSILAIPSKRTVKSVLGFMNRDEVTALLAAIDLSSWYGRRDHLLFTLLYNTGARVSEILQVRPTDLKGSSLCLLGKGRKHRTMPIWSSTVRALKKWCESNHYTGEQHIFINRNGHSLTRKGVSFRLRIAVAKAAKSCSSLERKKVTPHTFRHSAAMGLLRSGVPVEIIALWLGHSQITTTHGYIEADLKMKKDCMDLLSKPAGSKSSSKPASSHLLGFLEAL